MFFLSGQAVRHVLQLIDMGVVEVMDVRSSAAGKLDVCVCVLNVDAFLCNILCKC